MCLVGRKTFVPLSWICKKQGAVSHSSTEAEVVGLDAMIRLEGLPCLNLFEQIVQILYPGVANAPSKANSRKNSAYGKYDIISLEYVDWVPPSMAPLRPDGVRMVFVEDNDAVLKMILKGRCPTLASRAY